MSGKIIKMDALMNMYGINKTEGKQCCPFCNEERFNKIDLKFHLQNYCKEYQDVPGTTLMEYKKGLFSALIELKEVKNVR